MTHLDRVVAALPGWLRPYTQWAASISLGPSVVPRWVRCAPLRLSVAVVWLYVWWLS